MFLSDWIGHEDCAHDDNRRRTEMYRTNLDSFSKEVDTQRAASLRLI